MKLGQITPELLNLAVRMQMATPQDRDHFTDVTAQSEQWKDYVKIFASDLMRGKNVITVIVGAMCVGVEIGIALEAALSKEKPN